MFIHWWKKFLKVLLCIDSYIALCCMRIWRITISHRSLLNLWIHVNLHLQCLYVCIRIDVCVHKMFLVTEHRICSSCHIGASAMSYLFFEFSFPVIFHEALVKWNMAENGMQKIILHKHLMQLLIHWDYVVTFRVTYIPIKISWSIEMRYIFHLH